ncbi:MAG: hypothetical protein CBC25_04295 [Pelagibacteraceae bacterium TMED65]|nr:MAG: hypothetical protein CBC25_04295 [Pelagibacteraceae bacterium TMED65]
MNILYISSSADWHIDLWVKYFTKRHKVFLFSDKEDYLQAQPYENVKVFLSTGILGRYLNLLNSKSQKLYQLNKLISVKIFAKKIDTIIEENSIDVVHAHSLYYGFLASFISKNVPVIFTPMGSDIILNAQKNYIYQFMAQRAFLKSKVVTGDSQLLRKMGYKLGARKNDNFIIQNGVDTTIFYPKKLTKKIIQKKNDEILIFSPRGMMPVYNIDIIIKAFKSLIDEGLGLKLMICFPFGNNYGDEMKAKINEYGLNEKVIWLSKLTYLEMANCYNMADIVVSVPSSDSSPKSVYEAMFCGKPVVVSDLEWSYENFNKKKCFERVKVRDVISLSSSLRKLINNESLRDELSVNAIEEVSKKFSYQKNMEKMETIMRNIQQTQTLS